MLKKYGDRKSFESILYLLLSSIIKRADEYQKEKNYRNLSLIQSYLAFFMIMTLNLKNYPLFMKTVFLGNIDFFHKLVDLLMKLKKKKIFLGIINNLFLEEYKQIFFNKNKPNPELEQLFINEQTSFGEKYSEYTIHYEK